MMKKKVAFLLAFALLLVMPFAVSADLTLKIKNGDTKEAGDKVRKDYKVMVVTTEEEAVGEVEVKFTYGSAITAFSCGDAGEFVAEESNKEGNSVTCTFSAATEVKGQEIEVGSVVLEANKNAKDEDCTIEYTFNGAKGKINPNTGAEVPYAYIVGGLVLAAGVYFVTKKKSALHRI